MRLLVSGCTRTCSRLMAERPDRIGVLMTPRSGNRIPVADATPGVVWAADNDCFQGLHPQRWMRFLARILDSGSRPVFVACPDKVADAGETWRLYHLWAPVIRSLGLPVALVLQDGLERSEMREVLSGEWGNLAAVFVGGARWNADGTRWQPGQPTKGTSEWKLGEHAAGFIREAKERGKWVHVGRVNSLRRIRYFARIGVDSIDGTGFSAFGDKRMHLAVKWIDAGLKEAKCQPTLF